MNENKSTRRAIIVTTVCIVYLLLTIFYHHIDKYVTGMTFIILTLLIPTTFITIVVHFIKGLIQVFMNRKNLAFKIFPPAIISATTLIYTIFSPYRLDSESLESKIVLRACFEGTQNQATLKFRKNKTFEINWTGVFLRTAGISEHTNKMVIQSI